MNLFLIAQITSTNKTMKFWSDRFVVEYLKMLGHLLLLDISIQRICSISFVILLDRPFIAKMDERSRLWHERLKHLNL